MTTSAQAAKAIRQELKASFPTTKFNVRSKQFVGGESVDIGWTDGPTSAAVDSIVNKYRYGHYNGMEDIYEYSNCRKDIPQAKYIIINHHLSPEVKESIKAKIMKDYGMTEWTNESCRKMFGCWPEQKIWQVGSKMSF